MGHLDLTLTTSRQFYQEVGWRASYGGRMGECSQPGRVGTGRVRAALKWNLPCASHSYQDLYLSV